MAKVIMPDRARWEAALSADREIVGDRLRLSLREGDRGPDRPHSGGDDVRAGLLARLRLLPDGHPSALPEHPGGPAGTADRADRPAKPAEQSGRDRPDRVAGRSGSPDRPDQPAESGRYWDQVPAFRQRWADHLARWPDERTGAAGPDRPATGGDPPGSWRGRGGQYLSPEQHTAVREVLAGTRAAEQQISADLRAVERDNAHGARLAGWEYRLKGEERIKEKVAAKIEHEPGRSPEDALRGINDAIRYTFLARSDSYADVYQDVGALLRDRGYTMVYSKNHWLDDPEYKGINTRWAAPSGQRFEVQFHTSESLHAKQEITHDSYDRIREPTTGRPERRALEDFQRSVSAAIPMPHDALRIPDYEEAG
jgi:hypothetical protein